MFYFVDGEATAIWGPRARNGVTVEFAEEDQIVDEGLLAHVARKCGFGCFIGEFNAKEEIDNAIEFGVDLSLEACFKRGFDFIRLAEVGEVIHVDADIKGGLTVDQGGHEETFGIRALLETEGFKK